LMQTCEPWAGQEDTGLASVISWWQTRQIESVFIVASLRAVC
jgi:hypothetical protein